MNKYLIKKRFARNLEKYNEQAKIQKSMAEHLITLLDKNSYDKILEIGCGSGLLTNLVVQNVSFLNYTAIDIVDSCEKFIKEISSDIEFISVDMENFIQNSNDKFDLIISNAAFQWLENPEEFIKNLYKRLNKNGTLLFSTFGKQNFQEIYKITGESLKYKSVSEYENFLKQFKPLIEEEIVTIDFPTPIDVLKHMKYTGVNALKEHTWTKNKLVNFEKEYYNFTLGKPILTYNPIYIRTKNL